MLCFEPFLPAVLQIIAAIIGISITVFVKMLFLILARRKFHKRAFYRDNPWAANVIAVLLESWSLGITTLYVAKRMIFLLGASFIFVGKSQLVRVLEIGVSKDSFSLYFHPISSSPSIQDALTFHL